MYKSILAPKTRYRFDPSNSDHMREFAVFLKYRNWKTGCPFYLEGPYSDVCTMLHAKVAEHHLSAYMEAV